MSEPEGEEIIAAPPEALRKDINEKIESDSSWKNMRILWHSVAPYINCYDDQTEVLSDQGWRLFKDLKDEKVMAFDEKRKTLQWESPIMKTVEDFSGYMYRIETKQVSLVVTLDHRMLIAKRNRSNQWIFREEKAGNLKGLQVKYLKTGRWTGKDQIEGFQRGALEDWLKFLGYWLSEGHIDHRPVNGNYTVALTQNPGSLREKMRKVFERVTKSRINLNGNHLIARDKKLWDYLQRFGYAREKFIPKEIKELSPRLLRIFIRCFREGDGSKSQALLFTISNWLRDDLQEISIKAGFGSNYGIHVPKGRRGNFGASKNVVWNISQVQREKGVNKEKDFDELVKYKGKVYCLQVPSSWLLVRRDGKAVVSGNSGYGTVTRYMMTGLLNRGIQGFISAYYGISPGGIINWKGLYVLPVMKGQGDALGFGTAADHYKRFKCDLGVFHADFWVSRQFTKLIPHSLCYSPLDHEGYPDKWLEVLRGYKWIAVPSMHAFKELEKSHIPSTFVPHGVNTKVYMPLSQELSRKAYTLEKDKFVIGIVAQNNDDEPRKGWDSNFLAIKYFFESNPEAKKNTTVLIHTDPENERGRNLYELARQTGISQWIIWNDRYTAAVLTLPESAMAKLYNCMDVFLLLSRREGFCIPALEAQACGVPCILNDFSALSERNDYGRVGWLTKPAALVYSPLNALTSIPDPYKGADALTEAYNSPTKRKQFSKKSLAFAKRQTWDIAIDKHLIPLLKIIWEEIQHPTPKKEEPKEEWKNLAKKVIK